MKPLKSIDSQAEQPKPTPRPSRMAIRWLFGLMTLAMVVDVIPPTWSLMTTPKLWLSCVLNRVGLWQGQWSMFAPNPVLNNAYLTAESADIDGQRTFWSSPDWKHVGNWEKFYRFRYLNFYNRLPIDSNQAARQSYVDYLVKLSDRPIREVQLLRHAVTMIDSEDGSLPKRDDTLWLSRSDLLLKRTYDP